MRRWLILLAGLLAALYASAADQQRVTFSGSVRKVGGSEVGHAKVKVDGAGEYDATDSGDFTFSSNNLRVGGPVTFHVREWIVTRPCELQNGKTWLRDPGEGSIEIYVLKPGDPRLIEVKKVGSIIGCLIEEDGSQLKPKPKATGEPRSALPDQVLPGFNYQPRDFYALTGLRPALNMPRSYLKYAAYHPAAPKAVFPAVSETSTASSGLVSDEFLAAKAKELGFSVEELKSAIAAWTKSVEDAYDKGLAALQELRYAEASRLIAASIPSPPGDYLKRYVPLARAEYEQGRYEASESALRKVLAVHPDDPLVLNNLAVALDEQAKYGEAESLYKSALAIDEKALGPDHPSVATDLNNLAELYSEQGKYSEAESLYKSALAIDEKTLRPDHPSVAMDLNNLAEVYRNEGMDIEAEPLYQRALAIDEKALGAEHPQVATLLNNLGLLYYAQGKYSEAEPLYKRALAIDDKALGAEHPKVATLLNNLGLLYYGQGKYNEAEPLYKQALAIDEKALGPDHPSIATILAELGDLYRKERNYSDAEPLYKRALAIDEKTLGPERPQVALVLSKLAALYYTQAKYCEAEMLFKKALAIDEKTLGPNDRNVATIAGNLAVTLHKLGRDSEAEVYEQQAARIRAKQKQK